MFRVYLFLTNKCNLNCNYCYEKNKTISFIDDYDINKSLEFLKKFKTIEQLVFFGGEPLIEYEKIKYIIENTNNVNSFFISTNGILLDNQKYNWLQKNNVNIQYSINDIGSIKEYDNIFYHITLDGDDIFKLYKLAQLNFINRHKIWVSVNRNIDYEFLIDDLLEIKKNNKIVYNSIIKMFRTVQHVGKNCSCSKNKGILLNCSNGDIFPCANMMYLNYNNQGTNYYLNTKNIELHEDCKKCKNKYCISCICKNIQSEKSKQIICKFYKWLEEEKDNEI